MILLTINVQHLRTLRVHSEDRLRTERRPKVNVDMASQTIVELLVAIAVDPLHSGSRTPSAENVHVWISVGRRLLSGGRSTRAALRQRNSRARGWRAAMRNTSAARGNNFAAAPQRKARLSELLPNRRPWRDSLSAIDLCGDGMCIGSDARRETSPLCQRAPASRSPSTSRAPRPTAAARASPTPPRPRGSPFPRSVARRWGARALDQLLARPRELHHRGLELFGQHGADYSLGIGGVSGELRRSTPLASPSTSRDPRPTAAARASPTPPRPPG